MSRTLLDIIEKVIEGKNKELVEKTGEEFKEIELSGSQESKIRDLGNEIDEYKKENDFIEYIIKEIEDALGSDSFFDRDDCEDIEREISSAI